MQAVILIAGFLTALAISILAIPGIVRVARSKGLYGVRRGKILVQKKVPTLGGLAIFAALLISLNLYAGESILPQLPYLTAGSLMLFFIGIKDDILVVAPWWKLAAQILAAALIILPGGMVLNDPLGFAGISGTAGWFDAGLTLLFIVAVINAYNFIDGIDGLAGIYGILVAAVTGLALYQAGSEGWALLSVASIGGLSGFLWFNIISRKKKIYMGDSGTLVVGYILAVLAIRFFNLESAAYFNRPAPNRTAILMALLIVPGFDLLRIVAVRLYKKRPPYRPDRLHIHYRMVDAGLSDIMVSLILTGFCLMMVLVTFLITRIQEGLLMSGVFLVTLALSVIPGRMLRKKKGR